MDLLSKKILDADAAHDKLATNIDSLRKQEREARQEVVNAAKKAARLKPVYDAAMLKSRTRESQAKLIEMA